LRITSVLCGGLSAAALASCPAAEARPSVTSALLGLQRSGAITATAYAHYRTAYVSAQRSLGRLAGTRRVELGAVLENVRAIAAAGGFTASRLPALFRKLDPAVMTAFACIILLLFLGSLYSRDFLSPEYLLQQLKVASFLGVIATGMMLVILLGQIDLSVPWVVAVGGMMSSAATACDASPAKMNIAKPSSVRRIVPLQFAGVARVRISRS